MSQLRKASIYASVNSECWRWVSGYEALYKVSVAGQVFSLVSGLVLRPGKTKLGYETVSLLGKTFTVHRLVARAFKENPSGKRTVNHISGDKSNNHIGNLEWATHSENNIHALRHNLRSPRKMGVAQIDQDGNLIRTYTSMTEAEKFGFSSGNISKVCNGKADTHLGFKWSFIKQ